MTLEQRLCYRVANYSLIPIINWNQLLTIVIHLGGDATDKLFGHAGVLQSVGWTLREGGAYGRRRGGWPLTHWLIDWTKVSVHHIQRSGGQAKNFLKPAIKDESQTSQVPKPFWQWQYSYVDVIRSQCFNKGVTMSDNSFLSFKIPNAYKCVWNVFGKKHPSKVLWNQMKVFKSLTKGKGNCHISLEVIRDDKYPRSRTMHTWRNLTT